LKISYLVRVNPFTNKPKQPTLLILAGLRGLAKVPAQKFIRLSDERLGEFETQNSGIEPVKIGLAVTCLSNQRIQKLGLAAILIAKYILLATLIQNKLPGLVIHSIRSQFQ
jgi:hypothetical protein